MNVFRYQRAVENRILFGIVFRKLSDLVVSYDKRLPLSNRTYANMNRGRPWLEMTLCRYWQILVCTVVGN